MLKFNPCFWPSPFISWESFKVGVKPSQCLTSLFNRDAPAPQSGIYSSLINMATLQGAERGCERGWFMRDGH